MVWPWLLAGFLAGLAVTLGIIWLVRHRHPDHAEGAATGVQPPLAPGDEPAEREMLWSLRATERRLAETQALSRAMLARTAEAQRHAETRESIIDDLTDDVRAALADADALRRRLDETESDVARLETELEAARRAAVDREATDRIERQALLEQLGEGTDRLASLQRRTQAVERALVSARDRAEGAVQEVDALGKRLGSESIRANEAVRLGHTLRAELSERDEVIAALRADRDSSEARHSEAEAVAAHLRTELERTSADLAQARKEAADAHRAAAHADALVLDLRTETTGMASDLGAARHEVAQLRSAVSGLVREGGQERAENRRTDAERMRVLDLEGRLATLESVRRVEVARANSEVDRLRASAVRSEERASRIGELEEQLRSEAHHRAEAESAAESLVNRTTMLEDRLRAAADELRELDSLRERFERVRTSLAASRESLARIAGRDAADEITRLRDALRVERDRTFRLSARLRDGSSAPDDAEGLRVRISELEELIARMELRGPDDLTLVRGIGPAIRDILVSQGITTFAALAAIDDATLEHIRAVVPVYPERIERDRWIEQAAALAAGRGGV